MARPASETQYRNVLVSVWADERVIRLTRADQCLYLRLLTQPDVSACGVLPMRLTRWSALSADESASSCRASLATLESAGLVVVDDQTEEVWIRDYVRHDNGLRSPNQAKGVRASHERVTSELIHAAITDEYAELIDAVVQPFELKSVGRPFVDPSKTVASPVSRQAVSRKPTNRQAATTTSRATTDVDDNVQALIERAAAVAAAAKKKNPPDHVNDPAAWARGIAKKIVNEQGDELRAWLDMNPGSDEYDIVLGCELVDRVGAAHVRDAQRKAHRIGDEVPA